MQPPQDVKKFGSLVLYFSHQVDNNPIDFDTIIYINEAGNEYMVNEIQYFISDVTLYKNGDKKVINEWEDIHYVDSDIPETQEWNILDKIEIGEYDSIAFTFGINEEKNQSFMYVNPPERDMFWPEFLGGGYHYLKLNGKWKNLEGVIYPFDFHLGIGQIYSGGITSIDSIEAFTQNYFTVSLPNSSFQVTENDTKEINLIMHVENWFKSPHTYDHNIWGSYIMQNQEAMQTAKENGKNVFSIQIK